MDKNTRVTVHLSNDNVFEDVVLFGFTQAGNIKQAFPYELSGMRILEHPDGSKFRTPKLTGTTRRWWTNGYTL